MRRSNVIKETITDGENTYTVELSPDGVKVFKDAMEITTDELKIIRDKGAIPVVEINLADAAYDIVHAYVYTSADMESSIEGALYDQANRYGW